MRGVRAKARIQWKIWWFEGGLPLRGEISVSGSKNAALPILMASILLNGPAVFTNVPDLRDIHTTLRLLEILGCPCSSGTAGLRSRPAPCKVKRPMIW